MRQCLSEYIQKASHHFHKMIKLKKLNKSIDETVGKRENVPALEGWMRLSSRTISKKILIARKQTKKLKLATEGAPDHGKGKKVKAGPT